MKPRSPDTVMRLARMGSFHHSRLSFMRALLRRVVRERWTFERPLWEIDADGVGRAVYTMRTPNRAYSLVAFAHDLPDEMRSDRVIATAWDATFGRFAVSPAALDHGRYARFETFLHQAGLVPEVLPVGKLALDPGAAE